MPTSHLRDDRFARAFTEIITPFTPDGRSIDLDRLDAQIARQAEGGITGLVVAGTTGERTTLEEVEYRTLVRHCVEVGKMHDLVVVAGTGSSSTAHAVRLQRIALDLGADAGLSASPSENQPTQDGLYAHFATIAESVELPIMLELNQERAGQDLHPTTIERLYESPWVVSVKDAGGSTKLVSEIITRCPGIALLSGDDSMTLPLMALGGVGCGSLVGNLDPERTAVLCQAMLDHDLLVARENHQSLFELASSIVQETHPICVKAALAMMDLDSGQLRLPMTQPTEATKHALLRVLQRSGLLEEAVI